MLQAERDRDTGLANAATTAGGVQGQPGGGAGSAEPRWKGLRSGAFKRLPEIRSRPVKAYQKAAPPAPALDENQLLVELRDLLGKTRSDLERFKGFWLLRVFKYLPLWVLVVLGEIPLVLQHFGRNSDAYWKAGICVGGSLAVVLVVRYLACRPAGRLAASIADALGKARLLHDTGLERAEAHYQQELERIKSESESTTRTVDQELKQAIAEAGEQRVGCRMQSDEKASRALEKNDRLHRAKLDRLQRQRLGRP